ncbi:MAG: dipeptidase [Kofleriaceae bacterium]
MLDFVDHRTDPGAWAKELGISREAVELYLASDVIDLHIDSFIWSRIFGYDLTKRHGRGVFGARFYSQCDLPRLREARITGGIWVITTNPLRSPRGRAEAFTKNLDKLTEILESVPDDVQIVKTTPEYHAAVAAGKHAAWIGIQGGNALDDHGALDRLDDRIVRVTLVHLSNSALGTTSSPLAGTDNGISDDGRAYVEALDAKRIFVDLAHISKKGFWEAASVHDKSLPLICTHTGVDGVFEHWRNLDDDQLRAIADTGGTIGVMYESSFLGPSRRNGKGEWVADHLMHIVKTVGEDHASLGSDWDGAIITPRDLQTCLDLPRLVDMLLRRGLSTTAVQKILGQNFLRSLSLLRG